MATRNGGRWLSEQLDSIAAQVDVEVSLFVRDDASRDDTVDRLLSHPILRTVVHRAETPSGSASANFFALFLCAADALGDFDYVALADQDDIWDKDKLASAVRCLEGSHSIGYSAATLAFWPSGRQRHLAQSARPSSADYLFEGAGQGCTFVLRQDFFAKAVSLLSANRTLLARVHYHDWALYALCRTGGMHWVFDERTVLRYRQHGANDTGARYAVAGVRRRLAKVKSGWYRDQVDAIAELCLLASSGLDAEAARYLGLRRRLADGAASARTSLLWFVMRHGRRRLSDRLVLAAAVLAGSFDGVFDASSDKGRQNPDHSRRVNESA